MTAMISSWSRQWRISSKGATGCSTHPLLPCIFGILLRQGFSRPQFHDVPTSYVPTATPCCAAERLFMGSHVVHGFFEGLEAPHQGSSRAGGKHLVRSCAIKSGPWWYNIVWSCLTDQPRMGTSNFELCFCNLAAAPSSAKTSSICFGLFWYIQCKKRTPRDTSEIPRGSLGKRWKSAFWKLRLGKLNCVCLKERTLLWIIKDLPKREVFLTW